MQTFNYTQFLTRNAETPPNPELNTWLRWLPNPTPNGPWIAGGAVRRMITDGVLGDGDIDYFFRDAQQFSTFCDTIRHDKRIKVIAEKTNENNVQFTVQVEGVLGNAPKIQAINFSYFENVEQLLAGFDFTVCQFAYDGNNLLCGDHSLWDLARKRIVINNVRFPIATLRHMIKYTKQGFFACSGALTEFIRKTVEMGPQAYNDKYKYID